MGRLYCWASHSWLMSPGRFEAILVTVDPLGRLAVSEERKIASIRLGAS